MFDALTDKLQGVFSGLKGRGKLTDADIDKAMRAIRLSLLEADVSLPVVKQLTTAIKERATGDEVMSSITPDQQVVKIVSEELTRLMGGANVSLAMSPNPPTVILMAGLQGSGKTTCTAKLARHLLNEGRAPMMIACDVHRPAAMEQLAVLGEQIGVPVHLEKGATDPVKIATAGIAQAKRSGRDVVIVDTAGRLTIDADMMAELVAIRDAVKPTSVVLVVDAMTGQTAVEVATAFQDAVQFDGVVLSKLDGDARGGAALSVRSVTGKPILFVGTGEKVDALEPFHPDRMASRILGMGDVLSLIEKAQQTVSVDDAKRMEDRLRGGNLTLDDFLEQLQQVRKMGPLGQVMGMIPGFSQAAKMKDVEVDERRIDRVEAIISSMTMPERSRPDIINGSRRRRIAEGSGTTVQEVNQLLAQFKQMQKLMKRMGKGGGGMPSMLGA
ncbi:MAG: signal recognition particle protein [Actinobacteria bacterium]|jgi:signal recognition particle subunit SRP54|nr:signal recognition particle protein [Actinomycetota bacterium]